MRVAVMLIGAMLVGCAGPVGGSDAAVDASASTDGGGIEGIPFGSYRGSFGGGFNSVKYCNAGPSDSIVHSVGELTIARGTNSDAVVTFRVEAGTGTDGGVASTCSVPATRATDGTAAMRLMPDGNCIASPLGTIDGHIGGRWTLTSGEVVRDSVDPHAAEVRLHARIDDVPGCTTSDQTFVLTLP